MALPLVFLFHKTCVLVANSLTGMAAVAFLLVHDHNFSIYFPVHVSRAGIHAFAAVGTFIPVNDNLPHPYGVLFFLDTLASVICNVVFLA